MSYLLQQELDSLKKYILDLGALIEERLHQADRSVIEKNSDIAKQVIKGDREIDEKEVALEEEGLKLLALHQPVAIDLRFIVSILKINNDLERIGDLIVNISERSVFLAAYDDEPLLFDFAEMSNKVKEMLSQSLDSLVNMDRDLAFRVCEMDDIVDSINSEMYKRVEQAIPENPDKVTLFQHQLSICNHLERIADLATNIAEDVVYMIEGKIIRHKTEQFTD